MPIERHIVEREDSLLQLTLDWNKAHAWPFALLPKSPQRQLRRSC